VGRERYRELTAKVDAFFTRVLDRGAKRGERFPLDALLVDALQGRAS
jgi:hypothetical protein